MMQYEMNFTSFRGSMHANGKVFKNQSAAPRSWQGGFVPKACCNKGK